jgi:hypothetical protein
MQRRTQATFNVVQDLVISGLQGQFRRGDTFGIWTFNDVLHAGQFPLQVWSPESKGEIAARMVDFLKAQKHGKAANFEKVLPALAYVVERSERLTVILITSGEEKIQGTPFDQAVNDFFQRLHDQQQKARTPFVTVFSAHRGRMLDYALNTPPWPLQLPAPVRETQPTEDPHQRLQQALRGAALTSAPPHSVAEQKAQVQKGTNSNAQATGSTVKKPPLTMSATGTNKTAPGSVAPTQVVKSVAARPSPVEAAPRPKVETVKPIPAVPAEPALSKPAATATSAPAVMAKSQPVAVAQPKIAIPSATNTSAQSVSTVAQPAPSGARSNAPALTPRPSLRQPPSAVAATATPANGPASNKKLLIMTAALVVIAGFCIILWLRRSKPESPGSLITRSYDRGRKQ